MPPLPDLIPTPAAAQEISAQDDSFVILWLLCIIHCSFFFYFFFALLALLRNSTEASGEQRKNYSSLSLALIKFHHVIIYHEFPLFKREICYYAECFQSQFGARISSLHDCVGTNRQIAASFGIWQLQQPSSNNNFTLSLMNFESSKAAWNFIRDFHEKENFCSIKTIKVQLG